MAFHQAALLVDPQNSMAANELGVLLVRFGQLREARQVLRHCIATAPRPEVWHNLAVVHERLGEQELAVLAHNEWQRVKQHQAIGSAAAPQPLVRWVDPAAFAQSGPAGPFAGPPTQRTAVSPSAVSPR